MIKSDSLGEFRPQIRYKDGANVTLATVQAAIKDAAMQRGIPVAFKSDQVKSGGLFNSSTEDCVVLYHPEHEKDYFNFCIRVSHQGNYAFVSINDCGHSKLRGNAAARDDVKEKLKGGSGGEKVGALVGYGIGYLISGGADKVKLEQENQYYQCLEEIFDEIVS